MGARWGPDEQTASCLSGSTVCYLLTYYVRCHRCSQQAGLRHAVGNRSVWYSTTVWFWQVHSLRQVCITRQQSVELLLCLYFHWGLLDWPPAIQVVPKKKLVSLGMLVGVVLLKVFLWWSLLPRQWCGWNDGSCRWKTITWDARCTLRWFSWEDRKPRECRRRNVKSTYFAVSELFSFLWGPRRFGLIEILTAQSE